MTPYDKLDDWIDAHFAEETAFLQALVRIPTDTPPGDNAPHAERTAELLEALVSAELTGSSRISIARLRELPAALGRLVVVRLAEQAAGTYVPQAGARVGEILELAARGGRAELHVGGLVSAVIERGELRMVKLAPRGASAAGRPPRED